MIIRFTPEADAEIAEARHWYAHQREDLDVEFMNPIDEARFANRPKPEPPSYRLPQPETRCCSAFSVCSVL